MKKSTFSESQIVSALQKQEKGITAKEICREMGISEQTFYKCESKYGGLQASEIKRIKELEGELNEYKRLVGELQFENRAIKHLLE